MFGWDSQVPEKFQTVFLFLLLPYMLSIVGNQNIDIFFTLLESHLRAPMHFFLESFSFLGIPSTFIPQLLFSISTGIKTISFVGCFTQYSGPFSLEPLRFGF